MLLGCEEEDREDELGCQKHLYEEAARDGGPGGKGCLDRKCLRELSAGLLKGELSLILTPGKSAETTPALARAPKIWATKTIAARVYVRQPMSVSPRVTAGLNMPPLMRKKIQALTARLKPNASAM